MHRKNSLNYFRFSLLELKYLASLALKSHVKRKKDPFFLRQGQLPGLSITFPVVIFASVALLAGISMYWMPETLFAPMHQTTEEAEAAEEDFGIPYCGRRRTAETVGCEDEVEMENAKAL